MASKNFVKIKVIAEFDHYLIDKSASKKTGNLYYHPKICFKQIVKQDAWGNPDQAICDQYTFNLGSNFRNLGILEPGELVSFTVRQQINDDGERINKFSNPSNVGLTAKVNQWMNDEEALCGQIMKMCENTAEPGVQISYMKVKYEDLLEQKTKL